MDAHNDQLQPSGQQRDHEPRIAIETLERSTLSTAAVISTVERRGRRAVRFRATSE
jgi:hypothetical protein